MHTSPPFTRLSVFVIWLLAFVVNSVDCLLEDYDYIVIGAGSAGSIVASQLASAQNNNNVLLIEAGGDNFDPAIDDLQQYFNVAFNNYNYGFMQWEDYQTTEQVFGSNDDDKKVINRTISLPRGKVLGGTFSINAAAYVQANKDDFDSIAKELNDKDWMWENTKGMRRILEETLGITKLGLDQTGAKEFVEIANKTLGFPYNDDPTNGHQYGISPSFWNGKSSGNDGGGKRSSSFDMFVRPKMMTPGQRVTSRTTTQKQSHPWSSFFSSSSDDDSSDDQDAGVEEESGTIDVMTYHQVERLLYDENDSTRVIGVQCHNLRAKISTHFYAKKEIIISSGTYNSPQILLLSGIGPKDHLESVGIDVVHDVPGVGLNLRDHYAVATFWKLVSLPPDTPFLFQSPSLNMFGPEQTGQTSYQMELSGNFGSCVPLRQESTGSVRLRSSQPLDSPLIDPNIFGVPSDIDRLVTCLEEYLLPFFKSLMDKGLVSPGNIDPDITGSELKEWIYQNVGSNHHPVGTCKVGDTNIDDSDAVVDKDFKVHGMKNLRVIDASVFPKVPSGNTNAPTMTLAMIGAKKILHDNNDGDNKADLHHHQRQLRGEK